MLRDEMQSEIVEPIDLGVAGYTAGVTAVSHNERFSSEIPDGDVYAVRGPTLAWRVLVWAGSGLSREGIVSFLRTLSQ